MAAWLLSSDQGAISLLQPGYLPAECDSLAYGESRLVDTVRFALHSVLRRYVITRVATCCVHSDLIVASDRAPTSVPGSACFLVARPLTGTAGGTGANA